MSQYDENIKSRDIKDSRPKKKNKVAKVLLTIGIVIIVLLIIAAIVLGVLIYKGRKAALSGNSDVQVDVPQSYQTDTASDVSGDYVYHDGKKYKYNDKITTVLFAGIDKKLEDYEKQDYVAGGQADCIFVVALDTETGKYKMIAVSRDSMVDVNVLGDKGYFHGTDKLQLCLAYGYGDGKQRSIDNLKKSVSRLFFGIPVNSYMIFDLDVIPILNDQVGGVEVTVNEDLSNRDPALYEGANVVLNGEQAETFVRARDIYGDANQNNLRMERQKIYLTSFLKDALRMTKEDIKTPINMYNSCKDYTQTDIDVSLMAYYTEIFVKTGFDAERDMMKVPGNAVTNGQYAEYYVDNDEFFKMILEIYYKVVTE